MDSDSAAVLTLASKVSSVDDLAELLRHLRRRQARRRGDPPLTYRELAGRTGWSHGSIGGYFTGKILPPTDRFDALVQLLDASPDELGALADARDRAEEHSRGDEPGAAAGAARDGIPRQLPAAPESFTGRDAAIARLTAAAGTVIVIGTAGVGKTALAVHWAHQVADRFPDGQLYVNLRGFGPGTTEVTADETLRAFLTALGVAPDQVPAELDARIGLYRGVLTGRRVLILLDNAAHAEQVRPLLPGRSGSLVVVTSRNQLTGLVATDGAVPVTLDLLSAGEARRLLAARAGSARAGSARAGSARVEDDPAAAEAIVEACARLPLALVVVAARAAAHPDLPLGVLAGELRAERGRLAVLRDAAAATDVRSVFSWSYQRLSAQAAALFRLLALVPGPDVGRAAAAALLGEAADARRALAELTHASLLSEHAPGRFVAHDLLRAYAAELSGTLDGAAERAAATLRLLEHHLRTAHTAALLLDPHRVPLPDVGTAASPGTEAQALAWYAVEHHTLLAAVRQAAVTGHDGHAWRLAWTLVDYLDRRGHWPDLLAVQRIALAAAQRAGDAAGEAVSAHQLGRACIRMHDYDDAAVHLELALDRYGRIGDDAGRARVHGNLGFIADRQSRPRDAIGHLLRSLDLLRATGDQAGQGAALANLGWSYAAAGEHREALDYCHQALQLQQRIGDRTGEAYSWDSIGFIHHQLGEHEPAAECYHQALDLWREIGDRYGESETQTHLGDLHRAAGDQQRARACWLAALAILEDLGHPDAEQVRRRVAAA
ncbi:tetratricopeptide repeat protein [Dactylosporangium aurantiacum]|uniref:Tetratricopeptide repeat protein n=1 Tax=Dactylosporangium aurantiacum TaxID=35754 RepID=A0A9Q9MKF6_9ACTN|nr:tetratricopeptide repeat protein [Dactylosporangium aurantiacum]MDG6104854.1 tetratricopeptide repeat protein [Dactylosporangium aurantiacum]UWZ55601.1 tetratricopeptide repeat protein [Dactylosporangium aurantiacum]